MTGRNTRAIDAGTTGPDTFWRRAMALAMAGLALGSLATAPLAAEVRAVDPDTAIDGDLAPPSSPKPTVTTWTPATVGSASPASAAPASADSASAVPAAAVSPAQANGTPIEQAMPSTDEASRQTYKQDDLIGAAEGVFGKGAQGLASLIQDLLKKQGEPNGYIVGREGGGALVVGLRYGSGTLHHKVEGERPVYWTGPSIGFDAGANAANAFVLVYNLNDSEDLYRRFGAGEGQAYFIGGFNVSYLRRGDVVLIPVRMGAGLRLGANLGYMKFSEKQKWLPF